jgi:hypothetical protein
MKLTPWYLVAIAPIAVAGCSGAFLGHCAVLAVTLCIFVGTLTLGSHAGAPTADSVPSQVDPQSGGTAPAPAAPRLR